MLLPLIFQKDGDLFEFFDKITKTIEICFGYWIDFIEWIIHGNSSEIFFLMYAFLIKKKKKPFIDEVH